MAFLASCCSLATAAPYGEEGRETHWTQPNGAVLTLRMFGDEYYARAETTSGRTVVLDKKTLTYCYAFVSKSGSLLSSGIAADRPVPPGFGTHVDASLSRRQTVANSQRAKWDGGRQARWEKRLDAINLVRNTPGQSVRANSPEMAQARILAAPVNGNKIGLTILIQFPGDPKSARINFPTTQTKIERFCNEDGYTDDGNTGSVRDYYFDQSGGKLTYTQSVTQVVTVPHPRNYYNFSDFPANQVIFADAGESGNMLIHDAVDVLIAEGYDFSGLSKDATNQVLATNVLFAGPDSGSWAEGLWPHQSNLDVRANVGTTADPLYISAYQITNVEDSRPVIGTFCHENGHLILDYPDLYSVVGEGVGRHCLMGSGNEQNGGRTPSPIDIYLKDLVGWATITDTPLTEYSKKSLPTTGNVGYRFRKTGSTKEFFMVENRGDGDRWAQYAPDKGIAVWHVDETVARGNILGDPHYAVSLVQADGLKDLERSTGGNRGDDRDLFDLGTTKLSDTTKPNANWWDAKPSAFQMKALSPPGSKMDVQFGVLPPNTVVIASPNGGEIIFPTSIYSILWEANITGKVKIDLFKDGVLLKNIATDVENTGVYLWTVPSTLVAGSNYTVVISSLTNKVPSTDSSDAAFSINTTSFPARDQVPYGWSKPASAQGSFRITKTVVMEGAASLVSEKVDDGSSAAIVYKSNFKAGVVAFYYKVSSEHTYDYGQFTIDGETQNLGLGTELSGRTGWLFFSYPLAEGDHTLEWSYHKDTSLSGGDDSLWLDGVVLPVTTQELAVSNDGGVVIESGKATYAFEDVTIGSQSVSQNVTVTNLGHADLADLSVVFSGTNSADFTASKLNSNALKPGESTTVQLTFAPKTAGVKSAQVSIKSNDVKAPTFTVNLTGNALGLPSLVVTQSGVAQKDNGAANNFGTTPVGSSGKSLTFAIVNKGSSTLNNLSVSRSGTIDFQFDPLAVTSLAPGESTNLKITFQPTAVGKRSSVITILSNDKVKGPFEIKLLGVGSTAKSKSPTSTQTAVALVNLLGGTNTSAASSIASVEVVKGKKYNTLTVTKPVGGMLASQVEVSSNLLDWSSGSKHTTVLIDNATTLKVRDNTAVTGSQKRYIRLR